MRTKGRFDLDKVEYICPAGLLNIEADKRILKAATAIADIKDATKLQSIAESDTKQPKPL